MRSRQFCFAPSEPRKCLQSAIHAKQTYNGSVERVNAQTEASMGHPKDALAAKSKIVNIEEYANPNFLVKKLLWCEEQHGQRCKGCSLSKVTTMSGQLHKQYAFEGADHQ